MRSSSHHKFWSREGEQDDLFKAAKLLVAELAESKLLPDGSLKTNCSAKQGQSKR